jgi:hypothetical protein
MRRNDNEGEAKGGKVAGWKWKVEGEKTVCGEEVDRMKGKKKEKIEENL